MHTLVLGIRSGLRSSNILKKIMQIQVDVANNILSKENECLYIGACLKAVIMIYKIVL